MNELLFMLILVTGTIVLGAGFGWILHKVEDWNARRRMKDAKVFKIKY